MKYLGESIKLVRRIKKINRSDLSKRSGLSYKQVTRIEDNENQPRIISIERIANSLDIGLIQLLRLAQEYEELKNLEDHESKAAEILSAN